MQTAQCQQEQREGDGELLSFPISTTLVYFQESKLGFSPDASCLYTPNSLRPVTVFPKHFELNAAVKPVPKPCWYCWIRLFNLPPLNGPLTILTAPTLNNGRLI